MIITYKDISVKVNIDHPEDCQQKVWQKGNFYETQRNGLIGWLYRNLKRLTGDRKKVIDIGACFGNHSLFLASMGYDVVAIEPVNYFSLLSNCRQNAKLMIIPLKIAVSSTMKTCSLDEDSFSEINRGLSKMKEGDDIKCEKLSRFITPDTAYVKIDAEGMESDILKDAKCLSDNGVPVVSVEGDSKEIDPLMIGYERQDITLNNTPTHIYLLNS